MGLRSIIKHEQVRVEDPLEAPVHADSPRQACANEPVARIVRVDGRAAAIELVCGCGVEHLIELQYEDNPTQDS